MTLHMQGRGTWAALCACCLVTLWASVAAQCQVQFTLNQQLSSLSLTGGSLEPVVGSYVRTGADAGDPITLKGRLLGVIPAGDCSELDSTALVQQLAGACFQSDPELGPLTIQPELLTANQGGYVDLDIQGLAWQVNSTKLVARPGSPSGQYDSTIEATISKGYTVYRAVIYETPQNASLVGIVASSDARVVAAVTGDGMARVELRGLNLTFLSKIKNEYQGSTLDGLAQYTFQGTLVLDAAVGSNGNASAAAPAPAAASDEELLLAFQSSFKNGEDRLRWGTTPGGPCSGWQGVTCNAQGQVTDMNLLFGGLVGTVPASGWPLPSTLERLSFSGCNLAGTIPEGWALPAGLLKLDLTTNQLTGTLPSGWALPSGLQELALQLNKLEGPLPAYNLTNASIYVQPGNEGICGEIPSQPAYLFNNFTSKPRPLPPLPDCPAPANSSQAVSAQPLAPTPGPTPSSSSSTSMVGVIAGVVAGVAVVAVLALLGYCYWRRRKSRQGKGMPTMGDNPSSKFADKELYEAPAANSIETPMPGGTGSASASEVDPLLLSIRSRLAALSRPSKGEGSGSEGALGSQSLDQVDLSRSSRTIASNRSKLLAPDIRMWIIPFLELDLQRQIGTGSFGKVYLAMWQETQVAVKVLLDGNSTAGGIGPALDMALSLSNPVLSSLTEEASTMAALRHPNILGFIGLCTAPPCVVSEYCPRGSLYDVLCEARNRIRNGVAEPLLDWHRIIDMAIETARGCLYLHSRNLVHRDLRSPNLLISQSWQIKVADFNLSKLLHPDLDEGSVCKSSTAVTNPRWLAPEVLAGDSHTFASDIFSFGCILWELLTFERPWGSIINPWQVAKQVMGGNRLPTPDTAQLVCRFGEQEGLAAFVDIMQRCQAQDPQDRPSFGQIITELRRVQGGEGAADRSDHGTSSPANVSRAEDSLPPEAFEQSVSGPATPGAFTGSAGHGGASLVSLEIQGEGASNTTYNSNTL